MWNIIPHPSIVSQTQLNSIIHGLSSTMLSNRFIQFNPIECLISKLLLFVKLVLKTNDMFFKAQITANQTNSKMLMPESDIENDGKTRYAATLYAFPNVFLLGSTKEPL